MEYSIIPNALDKGKYDIILEIKSNGRLSTMYVPVTFVLGPEIKHWGQYMEIMNKKVTRILFVGNSITWHPVKEEIGWLNEWGMAASSEDNDYVHLLMKKIHSGGFIAEYKIAWAVAWEREYWDAVHLVAFKEFLNFKPDIIVVKIGENLTPSKNEEYPYKKYYEKLMNYLNPQGKSKTIVCTGFWKRGAIDGAVRKVAAEREYLMVELNHLDEDPELKAYDIYGHKGPGHHPGDKGMAAIADAIFAQLKKIL